MRILIRGIPPQGLELSERLEPVELELIDEEFKTLSPVEFKAKIEKIGTTVLAKVHLNGEFILECGRCLEPLSKKIRRECDFDYEIDKNTEFIDLGEDIRQEIVMALPAAVVCKKDCKGLCPGCGANLNKGTCHCKTQNSKGKIQS